MVGAAMALSAGGGRPGKTSAPRPSAVMATARPRAVRRRSAADGPPEWECERPSSPRRCGGGMPVGPARPAPVVLTECAVGACHRRGRTTAEDPAVAPAGNFRPQGAAVGNRVAEVGLCRGQSTQRGYHPERPLDASSSGAGRLGRDPRYGRSDDERCEDPLPSPRANPATSANTTK